MLAESLLSAPSATFSSFPKSLYAFDETRLRLNVRLLGMAGVRLVQIVADCSDQFVLRGVPRPKAQLGRVMTAVGASRFLPSIRGAIVSVTPRTTGPGVVGLDLPIALALLALDTREYLSPSIYASAKLAPNGRLLRYTDGDRWATTVGRLHHAPVDVTASLLPRIAEGRPVYTLAEAWSAALDITTWADDQPCTTCRRAARYRYPVQET